MTENEARTERLKELYPRMVEWRRYLHRHPELSFQEERTSAWIAGKLREMGCEVREGVGGHGVVAVIRGGQPGPNVALRADIDALAIQDEKTCDYASTVPGVMHACGHDAHTATMLGIASLYRSIAPSLKGERRLLFQPAEEICPGGAIRMIEEGVIDRIDAIYGVHLWTPLQYGTVATRSGPFMAATDEFTIRLTGKGGHGGLPHNAIDTVVAGAALVQALQTIVSRNVDPLSPAVVTIGSFQAGASGNVIAEQCVMKGTIRSFDERTRQLARKRFKEIVAAAPAVYGASAELEFREGYPALVNDDGEAGRFFRVAAGLFGEEAVKESDPVMAAEDFAYYVQRTKGCFMFVGAGNPECGAIYPHHHPRFDIDERAMLRAAELMTAMAENFVAESA
ncbi:putative amidohydrolase YhaA [Paenibacillus cisolokensis]|uniref:Amidohydrolase YhaA n=1 Tax=Paenibacillus cisolokensis TaxID=1658519 RepID=A0ABQ4N4L1_9BACL|nr:amidohydrolase [Paenibacillus cisolokensis]GIQ63108.1 putative amidohydrolase YhaA [Paenibacillus cisolokensis]